MKKAKKGGINVTELHKRFDKDRSTIRDYLEAANLPPLYETNEGKFYNEKLACEVISLAIQTSKNGGANTATREEKLKEEIRKLRLHNDKEEKKVVPYSRHDAEISEMATEVQRRMYGLPPRAPELAGLSVPDIEIKLTAWMDEVVAALGDESRIGKP